MKTLLISLIFLSSVSHAADQQFYIKDGATFKPVTKRDATVALLNSKAEVFKCQEQRLTDKLTFKAKSSD